MAIVENHPLSEQRVVCHSASIGASAAAAYQPAPFRAKILKFGVITGGVITSADATVTVAVAGTTIGTFTITQSGAAAGQHFSGTPTTAALSAVNEDDAVSFTPAGASGASIPGTFYAVYRRA